MALEEKDVRYVAELAHLELTPDEVNKFLPQLDSILQHMQKLNELDTSQVEPMAQVTYPAAANPSCVEISQRKRSTKMRPLPTRPTPARAFSESRAS